MEKKLFLVAMAVLFTACTASSESTLALQEKCAEGAKKLEQHKLNAPYPSGVPNPSVSFQNHYNKKLDKCFVRIGYYFGQEKGEDGLSHPSFGVGLYDVYEGTRPIGELAYDGRIERCYVGDKQCKSTDEFEALIKPYMEQ